MTKYKAGDEVTPPRPNGRPRKYNEPTMRLRVPVRLEADIIAYIKKLLTKKN